jgi:hypothetical protein
MTSTTGSRMMDAKRQHIQQQNTARAAALHRFNNKTKREKNGRVAGTMILLLALIIANVWAARYGWGLL